MDIRGLVQDVSEDNEEYIGLETNQVINNLAIILDLFFPYPKNKEANKEAMTKCSRKKCSQKKFEKNYSCFLEIFDFEASGMNVKTEYRNRND